METELTITHDIIEKFRIKCVVNTFNIVFPYGAKITDVPKLLPKIGSYYYSLFVKWLLNQLPFNNKILIIDGNICDNLFYNGDVIVKGDIELKRAYIKGNLNVDGTLTIKHKGEVIARDFDNTKQIIANEINLCTESLILATHIKANKIYAYNESVIAGDVNTNFIIVKGSCIWGNVDANEVINESGIIDGNVNTIKIENIDTGRIKGKITYKSND